MVSAELLQGGSLVDSSSITISPRSGKFFTATYTRNSRRIVELTRDDSGGGNDAASSSESNSIVDSVGSAVQTSQAAAVTTSTTPVFQPPQSKSIAILESLYNIPTPAQAAKSISELFADSNESSDDEDHVAHKEDDQTMRLVRAFAGGSKKKESNLEDDVVKAAASASKNRQPIKEPVVVVATTTPSKAKPSPKTKNIKHHHLLGKNQDMDFNDLKLADEVVSLSSYDDDEEDDQYNVDEDHDVVPRASLIGNHKHKGMLHAHDDGGVEAAMRFDRKAQEQDSSDDDSDDDVVHRQHPKRNPRGLLAVRTRRGSDDSGSGEESNSSDSLGADDERVENLFDESLDQIRQQEIHQKTQAAQNQAAEAKLFPIDVLKEVPFFAQFSQAHQKQLFAELEEENYNDGDIIVRQGDVGDKFYVIIEGEAVVSKTLDNGEQVDLTHIYQSDFFGELVLIYGGQRVATVTSYGKTKTMSLSRKSFEKYDDIRFFLILQKVPLLANVPKDVQLEIVKKLKPRKYNKDDYVIRQGERGDAFFMITKGSAFVIEDEDKIITRLYEGHSFGEMALLSDESRVASVKAAAELNVMYLSVEDFKQLLGADDFSKLLEQESKKIRELRDRRQWKRVNSVSVNRTVPGMNALGLSIGIEPAVLNATSAMNNAILSPVAGSKSPVSATLTVIGGNNGGGTPGTPLVEGNKRLRGLSSTTNRPAGLQQKLKTGKTSGGAKIINGYVLLDQIGKGTFGVVRLCEKVDTKEKFAIKIIDKSLFKTKIKSKHQTSLEDMRREAAIMKRLNHDNVVNLIDVIDDPKAEQLYLVQEYCQMGAIMENLEGNTPLSEPTARKYFRDLLCGIDYLHRHGIVHRDIKPMNLLVTSDHIVKIGDFGAARVLQGTQAVGIAGTPAFMAPELLSQDQSKYNGPAVDLWSCGATLFMLVTGVPPWMADDEPTLAKRVQNDELVFFGEWARKLSPHLRNLISRLLVKDPAQRMTLTQTMEHEWVTEEGADSLPRYMDLQPLLVRVNSSLSPSNDETKTAISMIEVSGSETPSTPLVRKKPAGSGGPAAAASSLPSILPSPRSMGGASSSTVSMNDSSVTMTSPRQKTSFLGNHSNVGIAMLKKSGVTSNSSLELGDSVLDVGEDDDESDHEDVSSVRLSSRPHAESVDYTQYDVGKKRDENLTALKDKRQSQAGFFAKQKKKMSVVQAFTRRVQSKERIRTGSKDELYSEAGTSDSPTGFDRHRVGASSSGAKSQEQSSISKDHMDVEEDEDEVSLSAMLSDRNMFRAVQQEKQTRLDVALCPVVPWVATVKAKRGHPASHCNVKYGYGESQGQRASMEDFVAIVPKLKNPDTFFAAIFDGHGGDMVAKELKSRLHRVLIGQPEFSVGALQPAAVPTYGLARASIAGVLGGGGGGSSNLSGHSREASLSNHGSGTIFNSAALQGFGSTSSMSSITAGALTSSPSASFTMGGSTAAAAAAAAVGSFPDVVFDSMGLPTAIRHACLALDRAMLHYAATELLDMESKVARGDQQKSLFRTKGGGNKSDAGDVFRKAGSTCVMALVRGAGGVKAKMQSVLTVGWVGDSRAVLCRGGKAIEVSKDHKAERDDEKARIRAAGGTVDRQGRLYGDLAVSRAFGDLQHKGRELKAIVSNGPFCKPGEEDFGSEGTLIALPDVLQIPLTSQDEFVILASDGLWDVLTSEQAVNFVRFHLQRHGDVRKAAVELVDKALDLHSLDNVSAVVIAFTAKW